MKNLILTSPIPGKLIALNKVKDPAFSSGAMGAGCGIVPSEGKVFAPFDAKVEVLFDTKHAIGLTGTDGESILIHIGIDTVNVMYSHHFRYRLEVEASCSIQLLL
jgi:PTS system sucrose-specific IIC component